MTRPSRRSSLVLAVACAVTTACADDQSLSSSAPPESARSLTPVLLVAPDDSGATVTVSLDVRGEVGGVGSFTGTLQFDPKALAFLAEMPLNDGALRASNPGAGTVKVAAASQTGIARDKLASFRFRVLDPAGLGTFAFQVDEMHEVTRADLRPIVRRGQAPRILK